MRPSTKPASALVLVAVLLCIPQGDGCPSVCNCTKVKNGPYLKVRCLEKIDHINQLDLSSIASQISHLDVSKSNIEDVGVGYFEHFTNLKRLDLSMNKIRVLEDRAFEGLNNLDVLKLGGNNITRISKEALYNLKSLKKLDISNNTLECDCVQLWLLDWARSFSNKGKLSAMDACASPSQMKRYSFLQYERSASLCSRNILTLDILKIQPQQDQVVFEGDPLRLQCQASLAGLDSPTISWFWGKQDPSVTFQDVRIETVNNSANGTFQSLLIIEHLSNNHSGQWNCLLVSGQANHSRTVSVIVISKETRYCPQTVTRDDKGVYVWPQTMVGLTAELPCKAKHLSSSLQPLAYYNCVAGEKWQSLNTSLCPFASEITRQLQDFSKMNLSEDHGHAIVDSAQQLLNLSCGSPALLDKTDVVFLSRAIKNYLKFLTAEKKVGPLLVDMVSCIVQLPSSVLRAAQAEDQACSRLVQSVETVTQHSASLQPQRATLALQEFHVTHESFLGITCVWYSVRKESERILHCYQGNNTAFLSNKEEAIVASVQIPSSLFYQLERQGKPTPRSQHLLVSMYENSHLFPRQIKNDSSDRWGVASSVIGAKLVGMNVQNLTEHVVIVVQAPAVREAGGWARPVWWDEELNSWSQQGCTLSHLVHGKLFFGCDRFGYFGLQQEMPFEFVERVPRSLWQLAHPAIYIGSVILITSLIIAIVTYVIAGPHIQMPKRIKHALINTWIAMSLLSFMFSIGVRQTDDVELCQSIGMILHYLTLSVLLWMAVTVSNMRSSLKTKNPLEMGSEDDLPSSNPPPKPLLGLYLVGWGIGLMVVGVSGAVNLKQYRYIVEDEYCFLDPSSALGAVLVPCVAVIGYLLVCALLVRCDLSQRHGDTNAQLSDGTQGTENVDLDLLDCTVPSRPGLGSLSAGSAASSEVEDAEHSPATQLRASLIVLLLFCSLWAAGALATAATPQLHSLVPHARLVFAAVYAAAASLLALFVLFFHCFARSDVRPCWRLVKCRGRNVSDARGAHPLPHPLPQRPPTAADGDKPGVDIPTPAPDKVSNMDRSVVSQSHAGGPVSNHLSSSTSINSSKSHNQRAAVELNKAVVKPSPEVAEEPHKPTNVHMMPVYRSYPSVTDAEMFYNPRQSDMARKFFRKQKRHAACNQNHSLARRRGDGEGNQSDLESTLRDSLKGSGSKVSNTNIHVEQNGHETSPNHSHNHNILRIEGPTTPNQERWVIGADSPPPVNNDGTVRSNISDRSRGPGRFSDRSSSRRRSRGIRDTNASHERTRENYHNISHNGTMSSMTSMRSRDVEMDGDFMRVSVLEETPNSVAIQKASHYPWDDSSVVSGVSYSMDRASEADNDVRSMSRSSRRSSKSPSSRRRHRRADPDPPSLRSHPTSLASSIVSLQNRDALVGLFPSVSEVASTNGIEDCSALSKKETCV